MRNRQKNINLGHIDCGECGGVSALRRNAGNKLYYVCSCCGQRPAPTTENGQGKLLDRANMWPMMGTELEPTPGIPQWIAKNWPWEKVKHDPAANDLTVKVTPPYESSPEDTPEPPPEDAPEQIPENPGAIPEKTEDTPEELTEEENNAEAQNEEDDFWNE